MEFAVIAGAGLVLEARHFAAMEHTTVARAFAITRDDRVSELGRKTSLLILAVHGAFLYTELDAAIVGSAVDVV